MLPRDFHEVISKGQLNFDLDSNLCSVNFNAAETWLIKTLATTRHVISKPFYGAKDFN